MAGLLCSAIVGFFCLQAPIGDTTNIKLQDQGIYVADSVQTKDWTLSWSRSMEWAPPKLDTSKLAKVCDGGACLLYWRKCNDATHPTKCSYALWLGKDSSILFDLTGADAAGLTRGTQAVQIVVDLKAGITLALSKLDRDGPGEQVPVLRTDNAPL